MAESNTDEKIGKIHDTVTGIRLEFADFKAEQKLTNKSVDTLCTKLDKYVDATEQRVGNLEKDVGNRLPDDPSVFSQLQSINGFRKRTIMALKLVWGFLTSVALALISQLFGLFGKGS